MVMADWIAIAIVLGSMALGALIGFGKGLKFFTSGIFGIIIGVAVCAMVGTVFLDVGFIGDLLTKFSSLWTSKEGAFYDFLEKIHIELVVYYIILFLAVQVLRIVLVLIIKSLMSIDNIVVKVINRTLGAVLFLALGVIIALLALKIIGWVGGATAEDLYNALAGSAFKLDLLFEKINPEWFKNFSEPADQALRGLAVIL